jgi:hypothetical protein
MNAPPASIALNTFEAGMDGVHGLGVGLDDPPQPHDAVPSPSTLILMAPLCSPFAGPVSVTGVQPRSKGLGYPRGHAA